MKASTIKAIIVAAILIVLTAFACSSARAAEYSHGYYVVADFIAAAKVCEDTADCSKVKAMCPVVIANDRQLLQTIRYEHPIRAKNGGMNIDARYSRAKRVCQ